MITFFHKEMFSLIFGLFVCSQAYKLDSNAYWWTSGDNYDPDWCQHMDELTVFGIPPDSTLDSSYYPGLLEYSVDTSVTPPEITWMRNGNNPGPTSTDINTAIADCRTTHGKRVGFCVNSAGQASRYWNLCSNNVVNTFAASVADLVDDFGLDFVDIDVEHPNSASDIDCMGEIYTAVRNALPSSIELNGAFGTNRAHVKEFVFKYHSILDMVRTKSYTDTANSYNNQLLSLIAGTSDYENETPPYTLAETQVPANKIQAGHGLFWKKNGQNVIYYDKMMTLIPDPSPLATSTVTVVEPNNYGFESGSYKGRNTDSEIDTKFSHLRNNGCNGIFIWGTSRDTISGDTIPPRIHTYWTKQQSSPTPPPTPTPLCDNPVVGEQWTFNQQSDYQDSYGETLQSCCDLCVNSAGCVAWDLRDSDSRCKYYSAVTGTAQTSGRTRSSVPAPTPTPTPTPHTHTNPHATV